MTKFKEGDKVTYISAHKTERGMIKSLTPDGEGAFVVYNCDGNWTNYGSYTAASTNFRDLRLGWEDSSNGESNLTTGERTDFLDLLHNGRIAAVLNFIEVNQDIFTSDDWEFIMGNIPLDDEIIQAYVKPYYRIAQFIEDLIYKDNRGLIIGYVTAMHSGMIIGCIHKLKKRHLDNLEKSKQHESINRIARGA